MNIEGKLNQVKLMLESILSDPRVPRNIKRVVNEAINYLNDETMEIEVKTSAAISVLDEISTDVHMPLYTRTQIWNIVTILEEIRNEVRKKK